MDEYLKLLNEKQLDACKDTEGPSLIIAGAGSGKTRVLTARIAYLIHNKGIDPSEILAITFTNKAAKEVRDRLEKMLGSSSARFVTCKTFHSLCAQILRNEISVLPRRRNSFQIIDDDETETLIKQAMVKLGYDIKLIKPKIMANNISMIKSRIKDLNDFSDYVREKISLTMSEYDELLIKNNLLDFDDLMLLTTIIFENHKDILDRYQEKFRYILVDEFQDTSNIQYEFIKLLGAKYNNVFIVGDEDQSIYSFRGANIGNLRKFMDDFKDHHKHVLDQNYRSTAPILECANRLISQNKDRVKKDLWTDKKGGSEVTLYKYDSDKAEARGVVSTIKKGISSGKYNYSDYAILYRNNFLSRGFENELIANQVPYRIYSGLSFYKRKEVKDMLSYLRLVLDNNDFFSFKRVINSPKRGVGDTTLNKIELEIDKGAKSLDEAIQSADIYQATKETINKLLSTIKELRGELKGKSIKDFFYLVYDKCEYKKYIDEIDDDEERESRRENIKELLSAITEVNGKEEEITDDTDIEEPLRVFLENISLLTDLDLEASDMNHVSLITMHSAKGLEFKNVFAVCLEDDIIPSTKVLDPKDYEEERRILYVCLTRAMENLFISYTESRYKFSSMNTVYPSRFLKDLGLEYKTEKDSSTTRYKEQFKKPSRNVVIGDLKPGEKVEHTIYGKGTILGQAEGFYIIKFDASPIPKKVIVNHPFLKKLK